MCENVESDSVGVEKCNDNNMSGPMEHVRGPSPLEKCTQLGDNSSRSDPK